MRKYPSVTKRNYFSEKNELKYMGSTQFKSFMDCEAKTMAIINGKYKREVTDSMLVGSYVDAYFEGTLCAFHSKHPEMFTRTGALKSDFKHAEYIIDRLKRDKLFMKYMSGKKQVIKTGEIAGVPFKIKIDSYHKGKCIVDLKIMKDFAPVWKEGQGRLSFIEAWGYDIQAAIYQAIEGNNLPFYIAAATKEKEPDLAVINIGNEYLKSALDMVESKVLRFQKIKEGIIEPVRCEKCDYCKKTKVLNEILSMEDIIYE